MALSKDWREFIELLNSEKVEYLIVGGFAVIFHGYPRLTRDIDFLVRPSSENAERILKVLDKFGFKGLGIRIEDLDRPDKVLQLGVPPQRIDLITSISGVTFEEAWESRIEADLDGIPVRFIGRAPLLRNKQSIGRLQDLADAEIIMRRRPPNASK